MPEKYDTSIKQAQEEAYKNFVNPAFERRRIFAETWGTFLLVFFSAGIKIVAAESSRISPSMEAIVPGLLVMVVIYFLGSISGAHLNPCVTLAFAMRKNFPWHRVTAYILAQLAGALLAIILLKGLFGTVAQLGATLPAVNLWKALVFEIILTTGLVNVILSTAAGARNIGHNGAIAVGGYIALAHMLAMPISGASMNPVRSLAPDLIRGDLSTAWIYVVGPLIGASIAVIFEWILKGKPTLRGTLMAQGCDSDQS